MPSKNSENNVANAQKRKNKERELIAKRIEDRSISLPNSQGRTPTPQTQYRIAQMATSLSQGMSRLNAIQTYAENWDISEKQAEEYYSAALKYLLPLDMDDYKKGLIQANIDRLEAIIEDTMGVGGNQYTNAINAIKELNKMLGLGDNKMVAVETPDTKFVIKFGE